MPTKHLPLKSLAMLRPMYVLLVTGGVAFRNPIDPGAMAVYERANPADSTPLSCTKQATIDAAQKHYFTLYTNINRVVYAALQTSVNEAFQVSNISGVTGWPAGMGIHTMLDPLSSTYGLPMPAALVQNNNEFCWLYTPADSPKVLFRRIENCAKIALIGGNLYTHRQIALNTICLLLTTGLYIRIFEEWDCLSAASQTWIKLHRMIQEMFQCRLNATAPTAGGHRFAPAFDNVFGVLDDNSNDNKTVANTVITQVTAGWL